MQRLSQLSPRKTLATVLAGGMMGIVMLKDAINSPLLKALVVTGMWLWLAVGLGVSSWVRTDDSWQNLSLKKVTQFTWLKISGLTVGVFIVLWFDEKQMFGSQFAFVPFLGSLVYVVIIGLLLAREQYGRQQDEYPHDKLISLLFATVMTGSFGLAVWLTEAVWLQTLWCWLAVPAYAYYVVMRWWDVPVFKRKND